MGRRDCCTVKIMISKRFCIESSREPPSSFVVVCLFELVIFIKLYLGYCEFYLLFVFSI